MAYLSFRTVLTQVKAELLADATVVDGGAKDSSLVATDIHVMQGGVYPRWHKKRAIYIAVEGSPEVEITMERTVSGVHEIDHQMTIFAAVVLKDIQASIDSDGSSKPSGIIKFSEDIVAVLRNNKLDGGGSALIKRSTIEIERYLTLGLSKRGWIRMAQIPYHVISDAYV